MLQEGGFPLPVLILVVMEDSLGRCRQRLSLGPQAKPVLILVVMEDSLGQGYELSCWISLMNVLILVVMEDSLGHLKKQEDTEYEIVLILVVMEDSLGRQLQSFRNPMQNLS